MPYLNDPVTMRLRSRDRVKISALSVWQRSSVVIWSYHAAKRCPAYIIDAKHTTMLTSIMNFQYNLN